ncbi:metallophosphoesterase [Neobacillus notoginsengisoli]|uniref:Phosphoesterase n=1 Tax=Neobacillus notoginsengisoli TaxID=1578198 RepID=A0A417YU42_9BACI|nr:metallophosphoesterase [Neobacillus notoginsengisoli]RHW40668.1 metallophosphoesterase [Neobacillus notoginsengisoli]
MKRILVVSDSHGLTQPLQDIREKHPEVSLFIHCGDSELPREDPALDGYVPVGGNCDFYPGFPDDELIEIAGKKIFVTHGHRHSVKSTLMNLQYKAEELGAKIVCFGHSHSLGAELSGGILFINPGSIRQPRGRRERTYVILGLGDSEVEVRVFDLEDGEIPGLHRIFRIGE